MAEGGASGILNFFNIMKNIKTRLGESNVRRFKNSCFGRFLDVHNVIYNDKLMQRLLEYLQPEGVDSVMNFEHNGTHAEFNPIHFYILTGLKFGSIPNAKYRSFFHERAFGGEKILYVGNIQNRFNAECSNTGGNSDESFRLAMVIFVYGVLFNTVGRYRMPIDIQYLHEIDNIATFNAYPWGEVAYEFLVHSMYEEASKIMDETCISHNLKCSDVRGFTLVMQLWAYECFPGIASNLSCTEDGHITVWPRMIRRWGEDKNVCEGIDSLWPKSGRTSYCPITPTEHENEMLEASGIDTDRYVSKSTTHTLQQRDNAKRKLLFTEGEDRNISQVSLTICNDGTISQAKNHTETNVVEGERAAKMLTMCKKVREELTALQTLATSPFEKLLLEQTLTLSNVVNYTLNVSNQANVKDNIGQLHVDLLQRQHNTHSNDRTIMEKTTPSVSHWMPSPDWFDESPDILTSKKQREKPSKPTVCKALKDVIVITDNTTEADKSRCGTMLWPQTLALMPISTMHYYDDPLANCELKDLIDVITWYNEAVKGHKNPKLQTQLLHSTIVDAMWFEYVIVRQNWLRTDSCDVIINMLMHEAKQSPKMFLNDWVAMDSFAFCRIEHGNKEDAMPYIAKYIEGRHPVERPKHWGSVRYIYGIANVNGVHWVAYKVDLVTEKIYVYDSMAETLGPIPVKMCFRKMSLFLPWACRLSCVFDKLGCIQSMEDVWNIVQEDDVPQQLNGHDCRIMALKFVQCMMQGRSVSSVKPNHCSEYRNAYCAELWKNCKTI